MSTCRGCHNDWRVPLESTMVTAVVDGPLFVQHRANIECSIVEPHHADVCGMFLPPRAEFISLSSGD